MTRYEKTLREILLSVLSEMSKKSSVTSTEPLLDWSARFLPHHFHLKPSKMHRWLADELDRFHHQRGSRVNILAPRNSAKSTVAALAFPLRELLTQREPYIWLVSDTHAQAQTHLENIKNELQTNLLLADAYPDAIGKGDIWRTCTLRLRNGGIIEAFGTGQRLRGRKRNEHRPTLIICDDLQNDQHIFSASAREKSRNWFHGTLLKAGSPQTNIVHLATALHREALALELLRAPNWTSRVFRAIDPFPVNMSLWKDWESIYTDVTNPSHTADADTFYEAHRSEMNEGAEVLWEEQESLYDLMKIRVEGGEAAFDREKQNLPINPDVCEFPDRYFDKSIWTQTMPKNPVHSVLALDPSKGNDSALGDYSAFVYAALGDDGLIYVDAHLARLPVSEIAAVGLELYQTYCPTIFAAESNQFQELLCDELERQFSLSGMPAVKIFPVRNTVNKHIRIRRLDSFLSMRQLRFYSLSPSCRLLVEQLRSFPVGSHDDGPDALEMALRILRDVSC